MSKRLPTSLHKWSLILCDKLTLVATDARCQSHKLIQTSANHINCRYQDKEGVSDRVDHSHQDKCVVVKKCGIGVKLSIFIL